MTELIVGGLIGAWIAGELQLDGHAALVVASIAALLLYLLSCAVWPYRSCPWCRGIGRVGDGRGNYRLRACFLCGGQPWRRLGARFFGS